MLVIQLVTGIFLTMNYKPDGEPSVRLGRVHHARRDWGWLIRYMHSTGASAFFIVVYLHMFRALLYGSHRKPRELLWIFGCLIFLCADGRGVHGLRAALGQHELLGRAGDRQPVRQPSRSSAATWWTGSAATTSSRDATLNRFFALHVAALPLALMFLVVAHLMALHEVGSNNPDGIEIKEHKDAGRPSARRHSVPSRTTR